MPRDNIDEILERIRNRRVRKYGKGPRPVPKAIIRRRQAYLPKPPPPKLKTAKDNLLDKCPRGQQKQRVRSSQYTKQQQNWTRQEEMEWYPQNEYHAKWNNGEEGMEENGNTPEEMEEEWPEEATCKEEQWEDFQDDDQGDENENENGNEEAWDQEPDGENREYEEAQWYQDQEQGQYQDPDLEQEWPTPDQEGAIEEWPEENPEDEQWMEDQEEDQDQDAPLPAPELVPTPMRARGKQPVYIPLHTGKGSKTNNQMTMSYPTPLSHPRPINNPLLRTEGRPRPILPPIMDPNHPVHKGKGWIMVGNQWQKGGKPIHGWIPPQPPQYPPPCMVDYHQHPRAHNQPYHPMEHGHNVGYMEQQYRITPPGMMGPNAMNWDRNEIDTEQESSERTAPRRSRKRKVAHGQPQKRKVILTIKGIQVPAYYWAP